MKETHIACKTGRLHCEHSMLRPRRTILKHPALASLSPLLKPKIENDAVFEDGNEQHDAEPGQHAQVLQDKVSQLAALVVLAVPMKHFWQLGKRQSNQLGQETDFLKLALQIRRQREED